MGHHESAGHRKARTSQGSGFRQQLLAALLAGIVLLVFDAAARGEGSPASAQSRCTACRTHESPTVPRPSISWFKRHFGRLDWNEAVAWARTPQEASALISGRVQYKRDEKDHWQGALETWRLRKGDCEDFAIAVVELCHQIGLDASVRLYFPRGSGDGHAIAYGRWAGKVWMSDLGTYREFNSEEAIAEEIAAALWRKPSELWSATLSYESLRARVGSP